MVMTARHWPHPDALALGRGAIMPSALPRVQRACPGTHRLDAHGADRLAPAVTLTPGGTDASCAGGEGPA